MISLGLTVPVLFVLFLIPGLFLVFVPFAPALTYMLLVALVFKFVGGTSYSLSFVEMFILSGITLFSFVIDWFSGILGAKYGGANSKSLLWGFVGVLIGTVFFSPFGGIAGLFVGILLSELIIRKDSYRAVISASGALLGSFAGMLINFFLALFFLVAFILFLIF